LKTKAVLDYPLRGNQKIIVSTLLSVKNLQKVYPGRKECPAVNGISFELREKEILGFLGPNGSGKTTTIQMLLGTLSKSSGFIHYFGKDFDRHRSDCLQHVAYASTYTSLPWILTVEENLKVIGRLYGISPKESVKRYLPLLERFGILEQKNDQISSLSSGQVTRLMLVKAFFVRPRIVLLDEPTASLDPFISREICEFLLEQRKKFGLSILFTSHKMEEVSRLCDRVIFLKKGKIIADENPKKLVMKNALYCLRLTLIDGMKRTRTFAEEGNFAYKIQHRWIEIAIEGEKIPSFLNRLGKEGINYVNIQIEEPSLEDYFFKSQEKDEP
jgi:ABC-2 type transport system ATP-binding protein